MNDLLVAIFTSIIIDENEKNHLVRRNGQTFDLSKSEGEHETGRIVEGSDYQNQKHENRTITRTPKSHIGHYAFRTVTTTRKDLGAFVSIGLPDKDFVVSLDELPTVTELWPGKGDRSTISLRVDTKDHVWGSLADEKIFRSLSKYGTEEMKNKDVIGTVYRLRLTGTYVLTEDFYLGFIHPSERYNELRLGEQVKERVIGVRPNGVPNLSLKSKVYEAISNGAQAILTTLECSAGQQISFTDKSDPEDITKAFGISKGAFKQVLGNLLK